MNDKEIIGHWCEMAKEGITKEGLYSALRLARQDERSKCFKDDELINNWMQQRASEKTKKLESESAGLKEKADSFEVKWSIEYDENSILKARWEKLKSGMIRAVKILEGEGKKVPNIVNPRRRHPAYKQIQGRILAIKNVIEMMQELESGGESSEIKSIPKKEREAMAESLLRTEITPKGVTICRKPKPEGRIKKQRAKWTDGVSD